MDWLPILLLVTAVAAPIQGPATSHFGLVSGREWVYVGSARWTGGDQRVRSSSVRWVMRCLAVRARNGLRAALVRGWIDELAWYAPGKRPGFRVLVEHGERLYVMEAGDSASAVDSITHALGTDPSELPARRAVIDSSLADGRFSGGAPDRGDRPDGLYAWHVEGPVALLRRSSWRGLALAPSGWRLAYRTLPDHVLMDFVPGVGITRYVYSHHGTVADTDVRLAAVRDAGR